MDTEEVSMFNKILTWIRVNLASVLAIIQVVLKALKEILTAILNALSIIMPASASQAVIEKIRDIVNVIDEVVEKIKVWFLEVVTK